nr:actin-related protein 2/3 complex subunit 5-like [Lytechinus pictus]
MSKSTKSTDFRKVNVDEFNENNYQDDDVGEAGDAVLPTDSEIQTLLNRYLSTPPTCSSEHQQHTPIYPTRQDRANRKLKFASPSSLHLLCRADRCLTYSKKNLDALQLLLKNPPTTNNKGEKDKAHSLVIRVLTAFKVSEVGAAVNALDSDSIDILMKYIYREFAAPSEKSAGICLTWHEKVYAVSGVGSIIRVLTDRKGV